MPSKDEPQARMMCLDDAGRADCHFMDKISPLKEIPEEVVARESLIAISYLLPDKTLVRKLSENSNGAENLSEGKNYHDEAENYISELISISNSESPDIEDLPVALGELNS
ncbi:unnamed protein product [Dovyalis caffra]|uniref:Uncharacterized protein n=1 Tax=Dovyalis caffra TaxID=77055 RepID=A0AAV1SFQ0_9ROSI|nr:unnamed protein product [Dovyalis caffra]